MAILDMFRGAAPFRALWVWAERAPEKNACVYFRKDFTLKSAPEKAEFAVFACDRYMLFINGQPIRRGPAVGTDNKRFYDVIDAGQYLVSGQNTVGAIVYNHGPGARNRIFKGPGAFIARLAVDYPDASMAEISTDSSWKTLVPASRSRQAPKINDWDVGYCEIFDAVAEPAGWTRPGFDDGLWRPALLLPSNAGSAFGELAPRPIPFLEHTLLQPVKCVFSDAGGGKIKGASSLAGKKSRPAGALFDASQGSSRPFALFDFGRIISGRLRVRLSARKPGGHVAVCYGESRDTHCMDAVILPEGELVWSSLGTRSFRYAGIALCGNPAPVKILELEAEEETFPLGDPPLVRGDKEMKSLIDAAANTLRAASRDYFVDCPGREQALWLGDVRIEALTAYYGFGNAELPRHSIELFTLMQNRDGAIPAVGPLSGDAFIPDYHAQWPTIAYDYYVHTADAASVGRWQTALSKAVSWMERELDRRSLIPHAERPGWWCFLDWADYLPREGYSGILNIFAWEGFLSASRLARAAGNDALASRWLANAENMRLGIYDNLYDRDAGLFLDIPKSSGISSSSRQVNALAVSSGLVAGRDALRIVARLLERKDIPPIQTPYFAWHYLEALFKTGHIAAALGFIRDYWGAMLQRGADCYWEMFDPTTAPSVTPFALPGGHPSRCHGWGTGVLPSIIRHVAGIEPSEAGFRTVSIRPALAPSIVPFGVSFRLPSGGAKFALEKSRDGSSTFTYSLPDAVPVDIRIPDKLVDTLFVNKKPVYSKSGPVVIPHGVERVEKTGDDVTVCLTTGKLQLRITPPNR